jgi:hypothetical protein
MPSKKPRHCPGDSWQQLRNVFRGQNCPTVEPQIVGGLGGLPPAYLSVPKYENCLDSHDASASHSEFCMPSKKPRHCPGDSWQQLKNVFQGNDCPIVEQKFVGGLPPAYLSVPGFQDCLATHQVSPTHSEQCLPTIYPEGCNYSSWMKLQDKKIFSGDTCRSSASFQNVAGYDLCLEPDRDGPLGWCKPTSRPAECLQHSWEQLSSSFLGDTCKPQYVIIGGDLGALPPSYLSLAGFEMCLSSYQAPGSNHQERCITRSKPQDCPQKTWNQLRQTFTGIGCPHLLGADDSAYSSFHLVDECFGSHQVSPTHSEQCLPFSKPPLCPTNTWSKLVNVYTGVTCPPTKIAATVGGGQTGLPPSWIAIPGHQDCLLVHQVSGSHQEWCLPTARPKGCSQQTWDKLSLAWTTGIICAPPAPSYVRAGPPAYLSVPGFKDCLDTHEPSPSHSEFCLPRLKPISCAQLSWTELKGVFIGISCPVEKQTLPQLIGATTGTPAYLSVPSYYLCLNTYQVGSSSHSEYCLPQQKPADCPQRSWNQLQTVFHGIGCQPEGLDIGHQVGAPRYLSVRGFRDCLGTHTSPTGSHSEFCLPSFKPDNCLLESWYQITDPEVFRGLRCSINNRIGAGPPAFLSVPGFQDCLGISTVSGSHSEWCLPKDIPILCLDDSWDRIKGTFKGMTCKEKEDSEDGVLELSVQVPAQVGNRIYAPGFTGALPPAYLSIPKFEDCLSVDSISSATHTTRCLPVVQPVACPNDAWNLIQQQFDGTQCPNQAGYEVIGHQGCLTDWVGGPGDCFFMEPRLGCEPHVHSSLMEAVFQKQIKKSAIIFPTAQRNINLGSHETFFAALCCS